MKHGGELGKKLLAGLRRYKYAVLILLAGVAILLIPSGSGKQTETPQAEQTNNESDYAEEMEARLGILLSRIDGAGQVEVMLTLQSGARTEYQTDTSITTEEGRSSEERKTVILSEGSAYDKAAVSAVEYPRFQGALIVCEGADSAAVKLNLIAAVSALTGLGSDRITVVKMK